MKQYLKNILGWTTMRKIVVISVDDYGNVRLGSKEAREKLLKKGYLNTKSHFDKLDALENRVDIEILLEILTSVKDKHNNPAVFTPFALPCNINFEEMKENDYQSYKYEMLPETYKKLSIQNPTDYQGTWSLWKEGIDNGLLRPQFHGREHLNLKSFDFLLKKRDKILLTALENCSNIGIANSGFSEIKYTASFAFQEKEELKYLKEIAIDGVHQFEKVFGYKTTHFMAPTANVHEEVVQSLKNEGILAYDRGQFHNNHLGNGEYKKSFNFTGKSNDVNQLIMVRNVVFEPTTNKMAVKNALKSIEAAFFCFKPAIISSHRVNFTGQIDPENRKKGFCDLKILLQEIVRKWPDVEFFSSEQLIQEIRKSKHIN